MHSRQTPKVFSFRGRSLEFVAGVPLLMGIVNVTPDSFSDGGDFEDPRRGVEHGLALLAEGAAILDIGGESTRPGAVSVPAEVELARILPVIEGIRQETDAPISVDTSKAQVARRALEIGADIVNDVTACNDPGMPLVLKEFQAGCVLMDGRVLPAEATWEEIREFLLERRDSLQKETGLSPEHFLLDPGVGFGKNLPQNLSCIRHAAEFSDGTSGALLGASRKSVIGRISDAALPKDRLPGTLAAAMVARNAQVLRVHDVAAHQQAFLTMKAILHS